LQATGRTRERGHSTQQFEGVLIASAGIGVQIGGELEHDPEKCVAVFRKDHAQIKNLERDDDST
jgi:hypothetical protein